MHRGETRPQQRAEGPGPLPLPPSPPAGGLGILPEPLERRPRHLGAWPRSERQPRPRHGLPFLFPFLFPFPFPSPSRSPHGGTPTHNPGSARTPGSATHLLAPPLPGRPISRHKKGEGDDDNKRSRPGLERCRRLSPPLRALLIPVTPEFHRLELLSLLFVLARQYGLPFTLLSKSYVCEMVFPTTSENDSGLFITQNFRRRQRDEEAESYSIGELYVSIFHQGKVIAITQFSVVFF